MGQPGVGREVSSRDDHQHVDRVHQIEDPSAEPLLETDGEPDATTVEPAVAEFAVLERDALGRCRRHDEPYGDGRDDDSESEAERLTSGPRSRARFAAVGGVHAFTFAACGRCQ